MMSYCHSNKMTLPNKWSRLRTAIDKCVVQLLMIQWNMLQSLGWLMIRWNQQVKWREIILCSYYDNRLTVIQLCYRCVHVTLRGVAIPMSTVY